LRRAALRSNFQLILTRAPIHSAVPGTSFPAQRLQVGDSSGTEALTSHPCIVFQFTALVAALLVYLLYLLVKHWSFRS